MVARFKDVPADYAFPTIERYELTGRQVLVYVSNLSEGRPLSSATGCGRASRSACKPQPAAPMTTTIRMWPEKRRRR